MNPPHSVDAATEDGARWWIGVLCLVLASAFVCAIRYVRTAPLFLPDEGELLMPAIEHLAGTPYPLFKYPAFPYMFYEFFFGLLHFVDGFRSAPPLMFARHINACLYCGNLLLFYLAARNWLSRPWATLGAFLFAFSPAVFFSAVFIKSESLSLALILICLIAAQKMAKAPSETRWHIMAGLACAFSFTTKYNFTPVFIYLAGLWLSNDQISHKGIRRLWHLIKNANTLLFTISMLAAIYLTWPVLQRPGELNVGLFTGDFYFLSGPSTLCAVDEWFSFPYGRYSYTLFTTMPISFNALNSILIISALIFRIVPRSIIILWGGFTFIYLAIAVNATLLRPMWFLTPCAPFFILLAVLALKALWTKGKSLPLSVAKGMAVMAAVGFSLYMYPSNVQMVWQSFDAYHEVVRRAVNMPEGQTQLQIGKDILLLNSNSYTHRLGMDPHCPSEGVERLQPRYLFVLDSYFMNFCKYRNNPQYARQCDFFHQLCEGKTQYRLIYSQSADYRGKKLILDPEGSATCMLFERAATLP